MNPIGISFNIGFDKYCPSLMLTKLPLTTLKPLAFVQTDDGKDTRHLIKETSGFGFRFDLVAGKLRRPVPPFWTIDYWKHKDQYIPWTSGKHAFVLTIPFIIGFFIACCIPIGKDEKGRMKQPGIYFGIKTFRVDETSNSGRWAREDEMGNFYLCPSASSRNDLVEDI